MAEEEETSNVGFIPGVEQVFLGKCTGLSRVLRVIHYAKAIT